MSAGILGQRFYNNRETPAWHVLGINDSDVHTAEEALDRLGDYDVVKQPMYMEVAGESVETGYYALVREPIPEDDQYRVFGSPVTADYELITPREAAQLYDQHVRDLDGNIAPVETFGMLHQGERLFISTRLPQIDVRGDEVDVYMLFDNPLTAGNSLGVYTTGVRVVCQNTLNAALGNTIQRKTIPHKPGAKDVIGEWLETVYKAAWETRELMNEAYNVLANKPVNEVQINWIVDNTYRMPRQPQLEDTSVQPLTKRLERWDREVELVRRLRTYAKGFMAGDGTGINDSTATAGTAFGAWNAVTELETYRKGNANSVVSGLINGVRAKRIQNAFTLAMNADRVSEWTKETAAELDLIPVKAC